MAKRKAPPKKISIKTEPTSLNESTLETNIVSEIAGLFNSPFNFGYPYRLRWIFEFDRINLAAFKKRKTKLFRLTPIEENRGGGWDTKISIPKGKDDSRAIFIQFKRGKHRDGNDIADSIFNLTFKNPNPHAEFTFNDNSNNNQHQTLGNLANHLSEKGISKKSVLYAFPRITKLDDFEKLEDELILYTTFLTIEEIDEEAKSAGANLYDGKSHNFRTCYISENRREISSDTFPLKNPMAYDEILYEIILVKLSHFRNQFIEIIPLRHLNNVIYFMLAEYLSINISILPSLEDYPTNFRNEIVNYFKTISNLKEENYYSLFPRDLNESSPFEWRNRLFLKVVEFFNSNKNNIINIREDIPSVYTFNLNNENSIDLDLDMKIDDGFNLLVF